MKNDLSADDVEAGGEVQAEGDERVDLRTGQWVGGAHVWPAARARHAQDVGPIVAGEEAPPWGGKQ